MKVKPSRGGKVAKCLAILLLASACGRDAGLTPTAIPDQAGTPPASPSAEAATSTPEPAGPTPQASIDVKLPAESGSFPLDLVVLEADNLGGMAPFQELTAESLPPATSGATLAFLASYEYSLAAHLDDGQTIVWNMASGAVSYQDRHPSDGSQFVENPALAISPGFQGYLATSATVAEGGGAAEARSIVIRSPSEGDAPFFLPAVGLPGDESQRVMSLAFSPDGHLLAVGMGGWEGGKLQIWDIRERDAPSLIREIAFDYEVSALQFTPDGSALVCSAGDVLVSLDPIAGTELGRRTFGFRRGGYSVGPSGETVAVWDSGLAVLESRALPSPLEIPAVSEIHRVAFSPDERLAVLADGNLLLFWDLTTGVELASFRGPSPFLDVRVFDNGRVLATIDEEARVLLWGVRGGPELPQTLATISPANAVSLQRAGQLYVPGGSQARFSPNSDWLAIGSAEGIALVDLPSLHLRRPFPQTAGLWTAIFDVSADGRLLAWMEERGVVKVWDLELGTLALRITDLGEDCCWRVLLAPDGEFLVTLGDYTARLWNLTTGQEVYAREGVSNAYVSPDGSRLAFELGLDVKIWDRKTQQDVRLLTGFTTAAPVLTTKFSPSWNVMYWVGRVGMQFADVQSGELGPEVPFSWGEFSPSGDRIAVVEDGWTMASVGQVHMIDVDTGETLAVFDHHADAIVRQAAFSPDGRLLATSLGDEAIKIWDAFSGEELATLLTAGVAGLSFSPDGRMLLSSSGTGVIELWVVPGEPVSASEAINPATARVVEQIDVLQLQETATDAVFSPDGNTVAVSTASGAIWFWDLASGQSIQGPSQHTDWIYRLAYDPTGTRLVSVSKDGTLRYRGGPGSSDVRAGQVDGEISALAFLPDGETVATSGEGGMLRLWDLTATTPRLILASEQAWVWDLAVSPAADLLATASVDRTIMLWDVAVDSTGDRFLRMLTGHTAAVWGVDFAPDGRTLASASWDGTVRLWDASTGELLATLEGIGGRIWSVEFAPDGRYLVSAPWRAAISPRLGGRRTEPGGGVFRVAVTVLQRTQVLWRVQDLRRIFGGKALGRSAGRIQVAGGGEFLPEDLSHPGQTRTRCARRVVVDQVLVVHLGRCRIVHLQAHEDSSKASVGSQLQATPAWELGVELVAGPVVQVVVENHPVVGIQGGRVVAEGEAAIGVVQHMDPETGRLQAKAKDLE